MKVLVTGAGGFVGRQVVAELVRRGDTVLAGVRAGESPVLADPSVEWIPLELQSLDSLRSAVARGPEAVIHLAAQASGAEARRDPLGTWSANVLGTVALVAALEEAGAKGAAEVALLEARARWGLPVVLARCFAQAGPGQRDAFVIPAWARRLLDAQASGRDRIAVGNLAPVREFVDVRDVARALALLLEHGLPGEAYNVAAGAGRPLAEVFEAIRREVGTSARAEPDPALFRAADIDYLVGAGSKLSALGWRPTHALSDTLHDVVAELRAPSSSSDPRTP
ncbi:MAG: NAD-dependent epimerase/dehydratase family protein [Gemmatimonadetes bacterium]|nr:NAD-dependent epimerase/dehydratase family protein [Gemmatimonadota bacterium]